MNNFLHLLKELGPYPYHSRVHPLKTFGQNCFVKRDDELGFGISGSKVRKYLSLIPYLLKNHVQEAIVIGGANSNNVLGLVQLLIENSIQPTLFLLGAEPSPPQGNYLLTSLFIPQESIQWIEHGDWKDVEPLAQQYADNQPHQTMIVPEGAFMTEALPGALTLALDILQNEENLGLQFDHIFLDAGTGLTAITTVLAFTALEKPITTHVVLMAEDEKSFLEKLLRFKIFFEGLTGTKIEKHEITKRIKLHVPFTAKSFGSTNQQIFQEIHRIAVEEGFLTDPVYTAKLFLTFRHVLSEGQIKGNSLVVHSGGGLSLMGFQEQLLKNCINNKNL